MPALLYFAFIISYSHCQGIAISINFNVLLLAICNAGPLSMYVLSIYEVYRDILTNLK